MLRDILGIVVAAAGSMAALFCFLMSEPTRKTFFPMAMVLRLRYVGLSVYLGVRAMHWLFLTAHPEVKGHASLIALFGWALVADYLVAVAWSLSKVRLPAPKWDELRDVAYGKLHTFMAGEPQ